MADDRYTRNDAERSLKRLGDFMGKQVGDCWEKKGDRNVSKMGCWVLDCNAIYGGCIVEEIMNESGGVNHPLTESRIPPREFCQTMDMIARAIEIDRKNKQIPEEYVRMGNFLVDEHLVNTFVKWKKGKGLMK